MPLPDVTLGTPTSEEEDGCRPVEEEVRARPRTAADLPPTGDGDDPYPLSVVAIPPTDVVAPVTDGLPDDELDGDMMSAAERTRLVLGHWFRQIRDGVTAKRSGGLYHARPKSFADHDEDIKARHWVPEGFEWKSLVSLWVGHQHVIGKPGTAVGYAIAWISRHAFAFYLTVGLIVWLIFS